MQMKRVDWKSGRGASSHEVENQGEDEQRNIGVLRRELFFQEFVAGQE